MSHKKFMIILLQILLSFLVLGTLQWDGNILIDKNFINNNKSFVYDENSIFKLWNLLNPKTLK